MHYSSPCILLAAAHWASSAHSPLSGFAICPPAIASTLGKGLKQQLSIPRVLRGSVVSTPMDGQGLSCLIQVSHPSVSAPHFLSSLRLAFSQPQNTEASAPLLTHQWLSRARETSRSFQGQLCQLQGCQIKYITWHRLLFKKLFIVYVKFKRNWVSCILPSLSFQLI